MEKVIMQEKPNKSKKKRKVVMIVSVILAVILLAVIGIVIALKVTVFKEFPELKGEPETGNWYRITPEDAKSSDGSEWHGFFRKGSENKVVVYFFGGGVSIDEYTAAHGGTFYAANCNMQDFIAEGGIGSKDKNNPFKDWTFLVLPYSTGDFHSGTGEFKYTDNGKEKTLYHNGYNNYSAYLEKAKQYVGSPDTLLVTGFSAGGFAMSLLADDVIGRFPSATNLTVCVDSSLILYDKWKETATDMWRSPTEIAERLTGNNLVLDSLIALHEKHGNSVKILFDCSVRDITLSEYQAYIREGAMSKTKANGDIFQEDLKAMVEGLQKNIEGVGIYVWEYGLDKQTQNTQHTIISDNAVFKDKLNGGKSIESAVKQTGRSINNKQNTAWKSFKRLIERADTTLKEKFEACQMVYEAETGESIQRICRIYGIPEGTDLAEAYASFRNQTAHGEIQRPGNVEIATYQILRCFVYVMNLRRAGVPQEKIKEVLKMMF